MAISRLAPVSTSAGDSYGPTAGLAVKLSKTYTAGAYKLEVTPTTSTATLYLSNNVSVSTVNGTVTFYIASDETNPMLLVPTGSGITVVITKVGSVISALSLSGTLDTLTNTQTYNQTGQLYVLAVGGGGGGGAGRTNYGGGGGGGAGQVVAGILNVNTSTSVTIGAAGNGGVSGNGAGGNAGTTNFGNYLTAYGGFGDSSSNLTQGGGSGPGGSGGYTRNTANSQTLTGGQSTGGDLYKNGNVIDNPALAVKSGTNGGGGAGSNNNQYYTGINAGTGAGSGIGTGGNGGNNTTNTNNAGNAATGYGAGGGGGAVKDNGTDYTAGGAGSPGVVYVLRGF